MNQGLAVLLLYLYRIDSAPAKTSIMNMMKLLLSALLLSAGIIAQAQKYTISGYVTDSRSGEPLIGVAVIDSGTSLGTTTGN